jgi:UDP-N-acetylglucosamine 2-epimerase (non-hydrolysing)
MIHVFLGTKAQYIKTAPLLRLLDAREVPYRLIDSGQHGAWTVGLRDQLGVRDPDVVVGGDQDVTTIPQAVLWSATLALRTVSGRWVRDEVFGGHGGVCVVHGDTPSTLLSALMAKRAGLKVAHLEAGLRSGHLLHPFPEELIRVVVMRFADLLFAPDAAAIANLRRMRVRGRVVPLPGNTVAEALAHDLATGDEPAEGDGAETGRVVVTMHRVENLNRRERVDRLVRICLRIAVDRPVTFVVHGPTIETLRRRGLDTRLRDAGVEVVDLLPHARFVAALRQAPFVITDGGSIQEECALLGVPTLLWRAATERPDGIGRNVVVSGYDRTRVDDFLADPQAWRYSPAAVADQQPSEVVLEHLRAL